MGIFHLFFGFSGRINRGKYWLTLVIWLLIWIVAIVALLLGGLAIFDRNLQDGSLPDPEDFDAFWRMIRELRRSIPHYSPIPDRELGFSAGDRRQAAARPGP